MEFGSLALSFLAGVFSTLSPCVLPLLPVVLAAAVSKHRLGPLALAAGLGLSFVAIGLFVATIGFALGFDEGFFRQISAVLMITLGAVLLVPRFEMRFALAAGPISNWTEQRFGGFAGNGLGGQFGVGLLLGAVWTPCVGPTLGAASLMAAQGHNLGQVAVIMFLFGIGTAVPLLLLSLISRATLMRWRGRMMAAGKGAKQALGGVLVLFGIAILFGLDRTLMTALVGLSPQWLTDLTTRF